ncbi:Pilus assembly protein, PilP [compost metagenome]
MNGRPILLVLACLLFSGCGQQDSLSDLQAWVGQEQVRRQGAAEPVPSIVRAEPFIYDATALRSPFESSMQSQQASDGRSADGVAPDPSRAREFLEDFSLEQLEMVGTLANRTGVFALLRSGGAVFRVRVGDYLGRNEGRVVAISEARVDIVEMVSDGGGVWRKRSRNISLKERS